MFSWLAAASLMVSGCSAPDSVVDRAAVIGRAQEAQSEAVRYCEYFLPQESGKIRVVYYTPEGREGQKIAEKWISGDVASTGVLQTSVPEVLQEDFRHGELRQVTQSDAGWQLRYRRDHRSKFDDASFRLDELEVIDAGFDPYVRKHWNQLVAGETVQFRFASPVHGRAIKLRARAVSCAAAGADLCLQVELAQAFLRWIAGGEIYLEYSRSPEAKPGVPRLTRFNGVSNLLDDAGEPQQVQIDYFYR